MPTAYYVRHFSDIPKFYTQPAVLLGALIELWIFLPLFLAGRPGRSRLLRLRLIALGAGGLVATYFIYSNTSPK